MQPFSLRQKELYETHLAESSEYKRSLDKFGFVFGIRLKEQLLRRILKNLKILPEQKVLDIGCRDARFLERMYFQYGVRGIGMDIAFNQLKADKEHNVGGTRFCCADAQNLPFRESIFDRAFCFDVFEHLSEWRGSLKEVYRIIKPGGVAVIYTISRKNRFCWHWFLQKISFGRLGVDKGEFEDHDEDNFLAALDIIEHAKELGFQAKPPVYFHAFFTLAFDELWPKFINYVFRKIAKKKNLSLSLPESGKESSAPLGVRICAAIASKLLPIFEIADLPWTMKGRSNGFYIILNKP